MSYEINDITFKELYNKHFKNLVYFARKKGYVDAEDMISDKFIKLWEQRTTFTNQQSVKAFLYISTNNAIKNYYRYQYRTILMSEIFDIEDEITINEIEVSVLTKVYKEIEKLSPICKSVFKKKVFENKTHATIAKELNITYSTVDNHYQRARTLLIKKVKYEIY